MRLEEDMGWHDSSLGPWITQLRVGHSDCEAYSGATCMWPRPGLPDRLARDREAVRSATECLSGSCPNPEVQSAMEESHILEKMAAEAGKKQPGVKPIKGITK